MDNRYIELFNSILSCNTTNIQFLETCHRNGNVSLAIWLKSYNALLEYLPYYIEVFKEEITSTQLDQINSIFKHRVTDCGPFIINVDVYDAIVRIYCNGGKDNILYGFDINKLGKIIKLKAYIDTGVFIYTLHYTSNNVFIKKSVAIKSTDFLRDTNNEYAYEQIIRDDGQFYNYYTIEGFKSQFKII